eukprot:gene2818-45640_t
MWLAVWAVMWIVPLPLIRQLQVAGVDLLAAPGGTD